MLLALLSASLALNVFMGIRLMNASRLPTAQAFANPLLSVGDAMGSIRVTGVSDDTSTAVQLDLERPTVVYVFRPSCPWCRANSKAINSLHAQASDRYRFVALSTESRGVAEFIKEEALSLPTFILDDRESAGIMARIGGVPATLVVDKNAVVQRWSGAYIGETSVSIERELGVSLPVVEPPRK